MAWNEPGGGKRDPWSGGGDQGPPDLDEVFRKARERIQRILGGRKGGGGSGGGSGGGVGGLGALGVGVILGLVVAGWLASGLYIVDEGWRGVVTRFGRHVDTTMPGLHWHMPTPIEAVEKVNVATRRRSSIGYEALSPDRSRPVLSEALMLTQDENIVNVQLAVQYEVSDPAAYRFEFENPDETLKQLSESALREVVGKRNMDFVLTEGRAEVAAETQRLVQEALDRYGAGLQVVQVAIQDIQPPEQVQDAFSDAIKAREDRVRLINEAQGYRNEVIPQANGQAARIREQALAYQAEVVNQAEGEASRFTQLLAEYQQAPRVTGERLYLDTMQEVLGRSGKVLVDGESAQPLLYLPMDRLLPPGSGTGRTDDGGSNSRSGFQSSGSGSSSSSGSSSDRMRTREVR